MSAHETSVSLTEAKRKFFECVDQAANGKIITITKYGRPIAKVVPLQESTKRARQAVQHLKALRSTNPPVTIGQIIRWKNLRRSKDLKLNND